MDTGYSFLGPDMVAAAEILKDRLYFVTFSKKNFHIPNNRSMFHFINIDDEYVYQNFFADFGPLHVGNLYRYCSMMNDLMKSSLMATKRIVHWTTLDPKKRANAAFLFGAYVVIHLKCSPRETYRQLLNPKFPFVPFQDASAGASQYRIKLLDCLNALNKACYYGMVRIDDFDVNAYEYYEQVENGDLNWIVPDKLLALSGPTYSSEFGTTPEHYVEYFKRHHVTDIIRLNKPGYHESRFNEHGIKVHDLYFTDGTAPGKMIVYKFFDIVENATGGVAVHCKAGLGRTGCLIGAYLVKHYKMSACEAIAWMRICRPGCVIGHQQTWLEKYEKYLQRSGELHRLRLYGDIDRMPLHQYGIYSQSASHGLQDRPNHKELINASSAKILKGERKKSSMVVVGAAASAVGTGMRMMAGLRRSGSKPASREWSQGETLRNKKWERQAKPARLLLKKKRPQETNG